MSKVKVIALVLFSSGMLSIPERVAAQAFGEYGRAVGGIPRGQVTAPGTPGGTQGKFSSVGVEDVGGQALPLQLVVVAKQAALFPRQDDQLPKLAELAEGEKLIPLIQAQGSNSWFMVKTEKGAVGWVKSTDVSREIPKKK